MYIEERIVVRAPLRAVWERIGDPTHWPHELGRMHCSQVASPFHASVGSGRLAVVRSRSLRYLESPGRLSDLPALSTTLRRNSDWV